MKLKQFVEENNGAPYDLEEFAQIAKKVTDDEIGESAKAFLEAMYKFQNDLEYVDVEMG